MSASPTPFRPALTASLLTAAAGGAITVAALSAAPAGVRPELGAAAACGVLLLCAAAFAVTWYARTARALNRRAGALSGELTSRDAALAALRATAGRETAAVQERAAAEAAAAEARHAARTEELTRAHKARTEELTAGLTAENESLRARLRRAESGRSAAMAAAANSAGRMQALTTSMLTDLREMEHRHADENVLTDLLHLDHRTAQAGRLADSIAVLTGARSGRRWARPIVMESILRGAMGRIGGYQRVRLHSGSDAAVAGHAAEGVMHALAELMDNAANFSPPTAEVHVYVEEVPAGVVITVEDSGLVMSDVQLRRAESAVSAADQDLAGLSGTRLGLAVVGRLGRKHGLTVSFRPSARGGTGALLMLPQELITRAPAQTPAAPSVAAPAPVPAPAAPPVPEPEAEHGPAAERTGEHPEFGESGLPRRRRGRTLAAAGHEAPGTPGKERPAAPRTGAAAGAASRFGSFRKAVRATGATAADGGTGDSPAPTGPADGDRPAGPAASSAPHGATSAPRTPSSPNTPHPEGNPE
ncbi:ATP-binding protein [Streptomyces zhihengii]|uniref:ATP-binding protein n=1 Tax=Streptomyces zhihengii TaxID=1818004 RepID=UPI00361A7267